MKQEIERILVDEYSWVYSKDGEIRCVYGDDNVYYYKQNNKEFNGRYVVVVEYKLLA